MGIAKKLVIITAIATLLAIIAAIIA